MDSKYVAVGDFETRLRAAGHSIGIVVAAFVIGTALALAGVVVLGQFMPVYSADDQLLPAAYIVSSALQFVGFLLVGLGYLYARSDWNLVTARLPSLRDVGIAVGGTVVLFVANLALGSIAQSIGLESAENSVVTMGQSNPEIFIAMIPVTLLLVGPGEELLFRGIVQGLFRRAYGPLPAVLIASALFGVVHFVALTGDGKLVYVAVAAALGLILGTIYELTDNLVVPVLTHGLWNAYLFAGQWVLATYDIEAAMILSFLW